MSGLEDFSIAIIGLGLIGGSMAGALKPHCRWICGIDCDETTLQIARDRQLIDFGTEKLVIGIQNVDIIILATPVRTILKQLEELSSAAPPGVLLMDLGSTKKAITEKMRRLPEHIQPLGAHPMCGKELSGILASDPDLFRGQTFILTPLERTSFEAIEIGKKIVASVGAVPLILNPEDHDRLVATISHLPYLLACALMATAMDEASTDETLWKIAASGFRDTSRLAASDVTMMLDILITNRSSILTLMKKYQLHLQELEKLIASNQTEELQNMLNQFRNQRRRLY